MIELNRDNYYLAYLWLVSLRENLLKIDNGNLVLDKLDPIYAFVFFFKKNEIVNKMYCFKDDWDC